MNFDYEQYLDRSDDFVARVRAAKAAAQRVIEAFGDPSEYEVRIIHGQNRELPETEDGKEVTTPSRDVDAEDKARPEEEE